LLGKQRDFSLSLRKWLVSRYEDGRDALEDPGAIGVDEDQTELNHYRLSRWLPIFGYSLPDHFE